MPAGDGTGPGGMGPMTGRGAGYCAGYAVPGCMNPMPGRGAWGWGAGRGWGRGGWGRRNWFYATGMPGWQRAGLGYPAFGAAPYAAPYAAPFGPALSREQEADMLKGQAEQLEDALDGIKKRIEELEAADKE